MIKKFLIMCTILLFSITFSQETGTVSWYGKQHHGKRTSSGEVFNMDSLTAASNKYPLGTRLKLTYPENNTSVIVKVNDRGGFSKYGRKLDLSKAAFEKLASTTKGLIKVIIEVIKD